MSIPFASSASSAASSRRRPSATTSNLIEATSINSGSGRSSRSARNVTTPPSGSSNFTVSVPMSDWMDGLWTHATRSTVGGGETLIAHYANAHRPLCKRGRSTRRELAACVRGRGRRPSVTTRPGARRAIGRMNVWVLIHFPHRGGDAGTIRSPKRSIREPPVLAEVSRAPLVWFTRGGPARASPSPLVDAPQRSCHRRVVVVLVIPGA